MARCSVVIPAYNSERYLASAIRSALSQTFADTEVIVVNDGSTDATAAVMDSFGDRITGVHQHNQGPSVARNVGMKAASGQFIAFLDSDDLWLPRRLEKMISMLDDNESLGFITSDAYLINEDRPTAMRYYGTLVDPAPFSSPNHAYWIVRQNYVFTGVVVRRELFDQHGTFLPHILAEDWDLWTRFIIEGSNVGFFDSPLGYYRIRKDGLTCCAEFEAQRDAAQYRTLRDPRVMKIPGLGRDLYYPLGQQALQSRDLDQARFCLTAATADPEMPLKSRAMAGLMATFPTAAARLADRQAALETKMTNRVFELSGGQLKDSSGRTYRTTEDIHGYLESAGKWGPVSGWAAGGRGNHPVDLLALFVDGAYRGSAIPSVLRPDVAHHLGSLGAVGCGFCFADTDIGWEPDQIVQVLAVRGGRYQELPELLPAPRPT